jgi:hypothetical protein
MIDLWKTKGMHAFEHVAEIDRVLRERRDDIYTGTVLGPRRPLMKTELKADNGTPAPIARNPAAACRPETTAPRWLLSSSINQVSMRSLKKASV